VRAIADNVELDPGSGGAIIATDDAGAGGQVQIIKLAISADGSATVIPADAANGLDVDVTRLPALVAGSAEIGGVNVTKIAGTAASVNSGNTDAGTLRVAIATDQVALTNALKVDGSAVTQPVSGTVTINAIPAGNNNIGDVDIASIAAGTNAIGKLAANSGVDIGDVDVTSISAGTNAIGNVGVIPRTTGGLTPFKLLDIDETEDEIKGTAGQVFGWHLYNDGAAEVYLKWYNATAANVTVGSTTPLFTTAIPAGSAANVFTSIGIAFSTAITIAATTAAADADTGAPATNQVVGTVFYT
jgi:hypothetical protein